MNPLASLGGNVGPAQHDAPRRPNVYQEITRCRMTGSENLVSILDLGTQSLTGVFPKTQNAPITRGPVELVLCLDGGLLQLRQSYDLGEMYGANYGYRSGLNRSMVSHLERKVLWLEDLAKPHSGDIVLDIGSNDATLLKAYSTLGLRRGGIDPSAGKFREFYPAD